MTAQHRHLRLVEQVAKAVRKACEEFTRSKHAKSTDFSKDDLECMCGFASFMLVKALEKKKPSGLSASLHYGKFILNIVDKNGETINKCRCDHVWVVVKLHGQEFIVDITATQFGEYPKVFILPPMHPSRSLYHGKRLMRKNVVLWFYKDWGEEQFPHQKTRDLFEKKFVAKHLEKVKA